MRSWFRLPASFAPVLEASLILSAIALVVALTATGGPIPNVSAAPDLRGTGEVIVIDGGGAWGRAEREAYFKPFEAATGIRVVANPGIGPEKLQAGVKAGAPGYDVYSMGGGFLATFIKEGLFEPIDYQWFDQADIAGFTPVKVHKYGVPDIYYSLVLAYDPKKFTSAAPKTWADFWDTKRFPGKRSLAPGSWGPDAAVFEMALLADGVSPAKLYPLDLDRAFRSLQKIRTDIVKFWTTGAEPIQLIVDGQVVMASAWNGRVSDLQAQGGSATNSWEQALLQYDYWVVPKGVKNRQNAMKFLAFVSRPQVQAHFSQLIAYGPTNTRAFKYIDAKRSSVLPTAPAIAKKHIVVNYNWWSQEVQPGKTNVQLAIERWEKWITGK